MDAGRERAVVEEAIAVLLALGGRIAALADVEWHSPAALLYRVAVEDLAADCAALRLRLQAHQPGEP